LFTLAARGGDARVATTGGRRAAGDDRRAAGGGEPGQDPVLFVVATTIDKPHLYDGERPDLL
jgi:hypothetical protein